MKFESAFNPKEFPNLQISKSMKIFSAAQIKNWDAYTIANEPITSINLMERAAAACYHWLMKVYGHQKEYAVFCGTGNNGGDGLAIARMLQHANIKTNVLVIGDAETGSADFKINLARLKETGTPISFITETLITIPSSKTVIIDAVFGTGLNRPAADYRQSIIEQINACTNEIVSIDIPSGLFADASSTGNTVINATHTLSFQCYKLAFLMAENAAHVGTVTILDIGLHTGFLNEVQPCFNFIEKELVKTIYHPRNAHAHKGNFGHAMIIGGSNGKMGAVILAAGACLKSGAGLLTVSVPPAENVIIQIGLPEAMTSTEILTEELADKYTVLGIGPGWGTGKKVQKQLHLILKNYKKPVVLDADALNCLSLNKSWLKLLSPGSVLTPHPKEFERLFGRSANDFERIELAKKNALLYNVIIVVKGHFTAIASPHETVVFNTTGNPGMAKGGSGDVLTGIITGLLCQGYLPHDAAVMGVYLHGLAGDIAAEETSQESMLAGDIINCLGKAFTTLNPVNRNID